MIVSERERKESLHYGGLERILLFSDTHLILLYIVETELYFCLDTILFIMIYTNKKKSVIINA